MHVQSKKVNIKKSLEKIQKKNIKTKKTDKTQSVSESSKNRLDDAINLIKDRLQGVKEDIKYYEEEQSSLEEKIEGARKLRHILSNVLSALTDEDDPWWVVFGDED